MYTPIVFYLPGDMTLTSDPDRDTICASVVNFSSAATSIQGFLGDVAQPHHLISVNLPAHTNFPAHSGSLHSALSQESTHIVSPTIPATSDTFCFPPPTAFRRPPCHMTRPYAAASPPTLHHQAATSIVTPLSEFRTLPLLSDIHFSKLSNRDWLCTFSECGRHFTRCSDLARHHKTMHLRLESFFCRFTSCRRHQRGFPRKDKRNCHERTVHGMTPATAPL